MTDWTLAACLDADPDVMFPDKGEHPNPAKRVCLRCPIIVDCLEHALTQSEGFGVWGGCTAKERTKIALIGGYPAPVLGSTRERETAAQCGTDSGSKAHHRRGEKPCGDCREAHRVYKAQQRKAQHRRRAA